jgi:hypothetical protein
VQGARDGIVSGPSVCPPSCERGPPTRGSPRRDLARHFAAIATGPGAHAAYPESRSSGRHETVVTKREGQPRQRLEKEHHERTPLGEVSCTRNSSHYWPHC